MIIANPIYDITFKRIITDENMANLSKEEILKTIQETN